MIGRIRVLKANGRSNNTHTRGEVSTYTYMIMISVCWFFYLTQRQYLNLIDKKSGYSRKKRVRWKIFILKTNKKNWIFFALPHVFFRKTNTHTYSRCSCISIASLPSYNIHTLKKVWWSIEWCFCSRCSRTHSITTCQHDEVSIYEKKEGDERQTSTSTISKNWFFFSPFSRNIALCLLLSME